MPKKSKSKSLKNKSSKIRRTSSKSSSMMQNKMLLHLSLIIFILNVVAFMFYQDMQSLFLFVVVLCMTYLFDQNMIIVLLTPSLIVGLLIVLRKTFMNNVVEGFKESHDVTKSKSEEGSNNDDDDEDDENNDNQESEENTSTTTQENSNNSSTATSESKSEEKEEESSDDTTATESYANLKNDSIKNELSNLVSNYEKAQKGMMETLEKSKLDPQSIETQREIINQMNNITPVIKDSVNMLKKVDMNGLNKLVGSLGAVIGSGSIPKPVAASTKM